MRKLRERGNSSLCIRHSYTYVIVNTEDGRHMVFYKQKRGSPWTNNLAAAERGLNQEENDRKNLENIEGPNKKWVFEKFFNVETKVGLDRQPLLGTKPFSAWQRNLRVGVPKMVSLDTFQWQRVSLELHCCFPWGTRRSEHRGYERVSKEG